MAKFASMWYGPMTRLERLSINSFVKNGHEHHIYLYDMENAKGLPQEAIIHDANEILEKTEVFQDIQKKDYFQFGDIFRIHLLKKHDYIWADLDTICLSPDWKWDKMFLSYMPLNGKEFNQEKVINNSIFYISKNSIFLDNLYYAISKFDYKSSSNPYTTSTQLFTQMFLVNKDNYNLVKKHIYRSNIMYPIHYHDIYKVYLKKETLYCDIKSRESFSAHLWRDTLKSSKSVFHDNVLLLDEIPEEGSWLYNQYQKYLPFKTVEEWNQI